MLPFLRRKKAEQDEVVEERWETRFSPLGKTFAALFPGRKRAGFRFDEDDTEKYSAEVTGGALKLRLKKSNLFAWIHNPWFRYRDFVLDGEVSFSPSNGYSSVGFLFKYVNEDNYYYFLISNRGYFRFDVVFNGNPLRIIPWTPCELPERSAVPVRIIAHLSNYSFYIDNEWIAEVDDETIESGSISFAGQNYEEKETAEFYLHRVEIESRPYEVEKLYYRWTTYISPPPSNRVNLAKTLYHQRQYTAALVQLRKASQEKEPTSEELVMAGNSLMNLELNEEALECMEKALELDPKNDGAFIGKAELLYLLDRLPELKEFLEQNKERMGDSSVLWNLLGNSYYALGDNEEAAEAYEKAYRCDPTMPLIQMNAARAFERIGDTEKALRYYVESSRLFFRQEAYNDLAAIIEKINQLDPENTEAFALKGKMLFHEGDLEEAERLFEQVIKEGTEDSSVYYLLATLKIHKQEREDAFPLLRKAIELEDDFPLYRLRYAENLHLLGLEAYDQLQRALELAPEDEWVNNFGGVYYLDQGSPEKAAGYLAEAVKAAPEETEIILNYAEALYKSGEREKAVDFLKRQSENPEIYNMLGNLFAGEGRFEEAVAFYDKTLSLEPDNPVFLENCAAANLELDQVNRAEELLVKAMDISEAASLYNLMGNVARVKGEHRRAEAAYREGVARDPEQLECRINLADLYVFRGEYDAAEEILKRVPQKRMTTKIRRLYDRVISGMYVVFSCASCGREWKVPRKIEEQPPVRLYGEPPAEAPAGKCPACGKIFCIECASHSMKEKRFVCPDCDEYLNLADNHLRYLLLSYVNSETE